MADSAFFCTLNHEGILAVIGNDASKFLQGQLTCNLNYLSETRSSLGARCTQKAACSRAFASFCKITAACWQWPASWLNRSWRT